MIHIKLGEMQDLGKEIESKVFHSWQVLGMKDDLWASLNELSSTTWKGSDLVQLVMAVLTFGW